MDNCIKYFYKISAIPRESGNEKEISNYLVKFAEDNNLYYEKDNYNNVIIKKDNKKNKTIILQAHMDMVYEKDKNINHDSKKNGIQIIEKNGYLTANGTTLGADNGIGMALILDVLENNKDVNIEALFTVEEETTMIGSSKINIDNLKGKMLLNIDGFEKNTIISESASFHDIILKTNYGFKEEIDNNIYQIELKGLEGGHSGFDINKNKGNSNILLCKLLKKIKDIKISNFCGGTKFNVIPSSSKAIINTSLNINELNEIINKNIYLLSKNYKKLNVNIKKLSSKEIFLSNNDSIKFIDSIINIKNDVICINNGYVTTSSNLGVIDLKNNIIKIGLRSSRKEEETKLIVELKDYSNKYNYIFNEIGYQPGFESNKNSNIIKKLIESFPNDRKKLKIKPEHVAVEIGILKNRIKDLEVAIISPEILDAHSINERVNIDSILECKKWLNNFLKNI